MATPLVSRPAPAWLRDLAQARARYEELLGWPVGIQVGRRDLVLILGGELAAIGMPARLGLRVRQELTITLLSAPIIADPGATHWTFLTKPIPTLRPDISHDLSAVRVRLAPRGACIQIPTTLSPTTNGWHWIDPPQPTRTLPPGSAIVATVRRLTYDGQLAA